MIGPGPGPVTDGHERVGGRGLKFEAVKSFRTSRLFEATDATVVIIKCCRQYIKQANINL